MTNETTLALTGKKYASYKIFWHQWQKSFGGWLVVLMTAATALFIFYQILGAGDAKQIALIADLMQAVLSLTVLFSAWKVTRHPAIDDKSRRAWRITLAAFISYAFGHNLWFYYSSILGVEPFPSLADGGFWFFYPLMLTALLFFPTAETSKSERLKFFVDVLIVMLAGSVAAWTFIISPTFKAANDTDLLMAALNLSYIVGDLVLLLGISAVLLRVPRETNRIALYLLIFGLINTSVADIGFAVFTLNGTYSSGHWVDNFFITSLLAFLIACHFQYQKLSQNDTFEETASLELPTAKFSWLPYLAIFITFGTLLWETRPFWGDWLGVIIFSSLAMTILVVFRQIVAVKENIRLLAEQARRKSEMKLSALVENSADLITIIDRNNKIIYESPSIKNVLGFKAEELVGLKPFELMKQEDIEERKSINESLFNKSVDVVKKEFRFRHKDGSWRTLEMVSRLIEDKETDLYGILVNSRDITKRKQDEEKLRLYTQKLEQSNRELQDFAYVASHDLQEPLRKVQAFGDRLERKCSENLGDEGRDYVRRMRDASSRMQNLINDLLSFSRVTSKAQPFVSCDLKKITEEVVSDLEVKIEQTGAIVEVGDLPQIDADPLQMRQLMQNLIGNALKFHKPDVAPVIKIYTEDFNSTGASFKLGNQEHLTSEDSCKIFVEDNGIGFDERYLGKIFTVFQRLHGRSEYEGSGVGLAVCRKIVERHEGEITAQSKPGEGAKFIIKLPINQIKGEIEH